MAATTFVPLQSPNITHGHSARITHPRLHLRDARDAHIILEAVRSNVLPLIRRRMGSDEKDNLQSGHVFVWEESLDDGLLARWTDGRKWSQSRMRGDYLYYEEKIETTQEEKEAKAARRARRACDPSSALPTPTRRRDRPSKANGLTKQTYSANVYLPGSSAPRKWHVVAYFAAHDYTHLPVIDNYEYLRRIRVPDGIFMSSKVGARVPRMLGESDHSDAIESVNHHRGWYSNQSPTNSRDDSGSESPYQEHSPIQPVVIPLSIHTPSSSTSSGSSSPRTPGSLPPISALFPTDGRNTFPPPQLKYAPLSKEDRRVLDSFRIAL